jgi:hypothetical protein
LFLILSYYYSHRQSPILGLALAILVGISSFYYLFSDFECKEDGTLSILARPLHKLNFRELFEAGLIVIFSYAAVFYSLNILYTNSFSSKLTILDSLYFSLITVATVGYGDINPVSNPAKILVMSEILFGLLFMLVIVSVFLSVFIKLHADEQDKAK